MFKIGGRWCTIRHEQAIQDKIVVVRLISKVAAIRIVFLSTFSMLRETMIGPFPNKTTLQAIIFIKSLPIFLECPRTITHRMCILTYDMLHAVLPACTERRQPTN